MGDLAAAPEYQPRQFRRWAGAIITLAFVLQFLIIWTVRFPLQHDTPNHMARHYLESRYFLGEDLPPFYEIHYRVLPNLGADLVVPFLMMLFDPLTACKIFLTLATVIYWLGPALFIWQAGDYRPGAMAASLLLLPLNMSSTFFWGFLNYYSGMGVAFLVLVHFNRVSRGEKPGPVALFMHALLVTLLFFWHLAPLVIYGVIMGSQVLAQTVQRIRAGRAPLKCVLSSMIYVLPMVPAVVLFFVYSAANAELPRFANNWGGWQRKLTMPLILFRTYGVWVDLTVVGLWLAALVCVFRWTQRIHRLHWLLLACAGLAGVYLVLPYQWGMTSEADSRVLPAILVCVLAYIGRMSLNWFRLAAVLLTLALVLRFGEVLTAWHRLDSRLIAAAEAFEHIPRGSRIMPVNLALLSKLDLEPHFVCWAVVFKDAYVPELFAYWDQQPLELKQAKQIWARMESGVLEFDEAQVRAHYDFVWLYNPQELPTRVPPGFARIFAANGLSLWRVSP